MNPHEPKLMQCQLAVQLDCSDPLSPQITIQTLIFKRTIQPLNLEQSLHPFCHLHEAGSSGEEEPFCSAAKLCPNFMISLGGGSAILFFYQLLTPRYDHHDSPFPNKSAPATNLPAPLSRTHNAAPNLCHHLTPASNCHPTTQDR